MFENLSIKSNFSTVNSYNIATLIDAMLFYREINLFVNEKDLAFVIKTFGEELLAELLKTKRLNIYLRQNIFGILNKSNPDSFHYSYNVFSRHDDSIEKALYRAHREVVFNSTKNNDFARKFSNIIKSFELESNKITELVSNDFTNQKYIEQATAEYLRINYPEYIIPKKLVLNIEKKDFEEFNNGIIVNSNLDIQQLNKLNIKKGMNVPFSYSGLLLTLGESRCDNYMSCLFNSELMTNKTYSEFIKLQLNDSVQKAYKSQDQISCFQKHVIGDCPKLGEAYLAKAITDRQLLDLLEKTEKWKNWLQKQPNNSDLINDYIKEITKETLADNNKIKGIRIISIILFGFIPKVGFIISSALSVLDSFYLNKLLRGWKPNQFIEDDLKPMLQPK